MNVIGSVQIVSHLKGSVKHIPSLNIPTSDGRIQTVTYTVDGGAGYVADVTYQGEAAYPPAPAGGYTA